jgi:hypothetical protein
VIVRIELRCSTLRHGIFLPISLVHAIVLAISWHLRAHRNSGGDCLSTAYSRYHNSNYPRVFYSQQANPGRVPQSYLFSHIPKPKKPTTANHHRRYVTLQKQQVTPNPSHYIPNASVPHRPTYIPPNVPPHPPSFILHPPPHKHPCSLPSQRNIKIPATLSLQRQCSRIQTMHSIVRLPLRH